MSKFSGNRDAFEMRPQDDSGKYWSSPPCRVRVDDGSRVTWIDLKRPYALIGSHRCCTLRIRGSHIPEIAYFACCLRDRVEIWPVAAIAFPRWGAIRSDLQVVVGPFSLTFHPEAVTSRDDDSPPFLADSEIETRIASPGQDFPKIFRRPVTIIGDDHPSVLRLHGRGMGRCQYAAVVQDQSLWLVDLAAKRMQRAERVQRFQHPGERLSLGDATLEFVSAKALVAQSGNDSEIGLGVDDSDSDIHSESDIHSDRESSGMSAMASGIYSYGADPSASFLSTDPNSNLGHQRNPSDSLPAGGDATDDDSVSAHQDEDDLGDDEDAALCGNEGKSRRSRTIGDRDLDEAVPSPKRNSGDESSEVSDSIIRRVDGASHGVRRPKGPGGEVTSSKQQDASSTEAALSLVDTALGLVDSAVHESDAADIFGPTTADAQQDDRGSAAFIDKDPSAMDLDADDASIHCLAADEEHVERDAYGSSDVSLTGHDPPMLVDRSECRQPDVATPLPDSVILNASTDACVGESDSEALAESAPAETLGELTDQRAEIADEVQDDAVRDGALSFDETPLGDGLDDISGSRLLQIVGDEAEYEMDGKEDARDVEADQESAAVSDLEHPLLGGRQDGPFGGISPASGPNESSEEDLNFPAVSAEQASPTSGSTREIAEATVPLVPDELMNTDDESCPDDSQRLVIDTFENAEQQEIDEMTHFEQPADPALNKGPVASSKMPVPSTEPDEQAHSQRQTPARPREPFSRAKPAPARTSSTPASRSAVATHQNDRSVDPEALTSHITSRLTEIRPSRSLLQQTLRWFMITAGIIVPATVVVWVVQRIYFDLY